MKLLMIWLLGVPAVVAAMLLAFSVATPHVAEAQMAEAHGKPVKASVQRHSHDMRSAIAK